jgi:2-keto-3-deoxy-L-rhamnonate aldolase RhmA
MAPMLESADEARLLVESAKFPPVGRRGFGVIMRDELEGGPAAMTERANRENLVIAQIESPAGIENADSIVAVPGVDAVWLGQFDLSLSLGIPGEFTHPRFTEAVDHLLDVCRRHQKPLGQMIASTTDGAAAAALGFQILAYADVWVFENALRDEMGALRRSVTEQRSG